MRARDRIDELPGDADTAPGLAHATFQHIANAKLAPDLLHVDAMPLVDEARITGGHRQPAHARQPGDDFLHDTVGEMFLPGVVAHILERQHRDGRLIRKGHRFGDILQRLRAQILKRNVYLAPNLPMCIVGNADSARFGDPFKSHRNIDPITIDVIVFDDNITDVDADAKFDPFVLRYIGVLCGNAALNFDGTAYRINHAAELNESAVTGILDDASAVFG